MYNRPLNHDIDGQLFLGCALYYTQIQFLRAEYTANSTVIKTWEFLMDIVSKLLQTTLH